MKNKKDFNLYYIEQLKSIASRLLDNDIYFENKIRRWYSKTFYTPLHQTFDLSWEFILKHYYESELEELNFNEVFDLAIRNYLPEFIDKMEQKDQEFADSLIEEQNQTLRKAQSKRDKKDKDNGIEETKDTSIKPIVNMNFNEKDFESDKD